MDLKDTIKYFKESENFWIGLIRDLLFVFFAVAIFSSISYIAVGRWSPMVAVESESMDPHMQVGDIIFVENADRTDIITFETGKTTGYASFGEYGDVILYKRDGKDGANPIIHRAMYYVNAGEPMWEGGPLAPHSGYITKGDNSQTNPGYDQQGSVSYLKPVKKEWVIAVTRFYRVPVLGYISLIPRKALSG